jgi:protein SCO1/2
VNQAHDATRRALLVALGLGASGVVPAGAVGHDEEPGPVRPPRVIPDIAIALEDGRSTGLRALCTGRVTALQFVLTACSSMCPVLGAIFSQVQQLLAIDGFGDVQLVSLSLDPLGDTPQGLTRWMRSFHAGPNWHAALPRVDQSALVGALLALGVNGTIERDRHTATVLAIDRNARLVWRSESLPDSIHLSRILTDLSA